MEWLYPMRFISSVFLVVITSFAVSLTAQQPKAVEKGFLVRMFERELTLQPTAGPNNVGNCMIVFRNGKFHLELRRQEFFDGHATLAVYESSLSEQELQSLRKILENQEVKQLPPFVQPKPPVDSHGYQIFRADILRGSNNQSAGYFNWNAQPPANAESEKEHWKQSELALKPLVEWFHGIKSFKTSDWRRISPDAHGGVCGGLD